MVLHTPPPHVANCKRRFANMEHKTQKHVAFSVSFLLSIYIKITYERPRLGTPIANIKMSVTPDMGFGVKRKAKPSRRKEGWL
jgi:hypothetical protein